MRMERSLSVLAAAVLGGWLIAVLLCNALFYRNIVNYEVLYQGIAGCWSKGSELDRTRRLWLLAVRILQAAVVYVMMRSRLRRSASLFLGLAAGVCGGMLLSLLVWSRGVSGGFLFLASGFPQDLAYLPSFFLLLICGRSDRPVQKERLFCITIILLAAGIWMELYVSPLILKLF